MPRIVDWLQVRTPVKGYPPDSTFPKVDIPQTEALRRQLLLIDLFGWIGVLPECLGLRT